MIISCATYYPVGRPVAHIQVVMRNAHPLFTWRYESGGGAAMTGQLFRREGESKLWATKALLRRKWWRRRTHSVKRRRHAIPRIIRCDAAELTVIFAACPICPGEKWNNECAANPVVDRKGPVCKCRVGNRDPWYVALMFVPPGLASYRRNCLYIINASLHAVSEH